MTSPIAPVETIDADPAHRQARYVLSRKRHVERQRWQLTRKVSRAIKSITASRESRPQAVALRGPG